MKRTVALAAAACVPLLAACGQDRREPSSARPVVASQTTAVRVSRAGLDLRLPANMTITRPKTGTTVLKATLGDSYLAVFAYPRKEQIPRNAEEMADARRRLSRTVQDREKAYRLIRSRATEVGGNRAVELIGTQAFSRTRNRTRSLHVYDGRAEYVIEIGAPDREFARFDQRLHALVERSLRVTGRVRTS